MGDSGPGAHDPGAHDPKGRRTAVLLAYLVRDVHPALLSALGAVGQRDDGPVAALLEGKRAELYPRLRACSLEGATDPTDRNLDRQLDKKQQTHAVTKEQLALLKSTKMLQ